MIDQNVKIKSPNKHHLAGLKIKTNSKEMFLPHLRSFLSFQIRYLLMLQNHLSLLNQVTRPLMLLVLPNHTKGLLLKCVVLWLMQRQHFHLGKCKLQMLDLIQHQSVVMCQTEVLYTIKRHNFLQQLKCQLFRLKVLRPPRMNLLIPY